MQPKNIAFAGSANICKSFIHVLHKDDRFNLQNIITKSCISKTRKQLITPIEQYALDHSIKLWTPQTLHDLSEHNFAQYEAVIVLAYGRIIPSYLLQQTKWLNLHGSLLPRWRGAAPIQHAILHGDEKTGITLMHMDAAVDTGAIIDQIIVSLTHDDTTASVLEHFAKIGPTWAANSIFKYLNNELHTYPQDFSCATYAPKLHHDDSILDWSKSALQLERQIRACIPWPGTHLIVHGKQFKPLVVKAIPYDKTKTMPGTVVDKNLTILCGEGALEIKRLIPYGQRSMDTAEFIRGFSIPIGSLVMNIKSIKKT